MKVIIIGYEYSGKSSLANSLSEWGKKHDMNFHLDDHFTIPDASLSKEDREVMLTLSPAFKERFQRFQAVYHVGIVGLERDAIEVGFFSEDAIYGPLYYGYKLDALAIKQERELEKGKVCSINDSREDKDRHNRSVARGGSSRVSE